MSTTFTTTQISDALGLLGYEDKTATGGFRLLGGTPGATAIGRAFTVQQGPLTAGPDGKPLPARHGEAGSTLAASGDILVIDVPGDIDAASWGEAHTIRAGKRGVAGVVLNGLLRDVGAIDAQTMPVLCRGSSPRRSGGMMSTLATGAELRVAGIRIRPGDIVALDADGMVCVPAELWDAVRARAQAVADKEAARNKTLTAKA